MSGSDQVLRMADWEGPRSIAETPIARYLKRRVSEDLKSVKEIRIAVSASAFVLGFVLFQLLSGSIEALPQATQKENVPPASVQPGQDPGAAVYAKNCSVCHGKQREGNPPVFP